MEGFTSETCSLDSSHQTNYIQLLSIADSDSLTQPAFANTNYFSSGPCSTTVIVQDIGNALIQETGNGLVYEVAGQNINASDATLCVGYDGVQGSYTILGNVINGNANLPTTSMVSSPTIYATLGDHSTNELKNLTFADIDKLPDSFMVSVPATSSNILEQPSNFCSASSDKSSTSQRRSSAERGGWPKGKKRKKTHPRLGSPSPPASAYVIFSRKRRPLLRVENPSLTNAELTKLIGGEWSLLSKNEKQQYSQLANADLERYKRELSAYKQSPEYQNYLQEKRREKRGTCAGIETNNNAETSQKEIDNQLFDDSSMTETSSGLYCSDCDMYFVSQFNKSEHLRSAKHRQHTVGAFEKYLTNIASKSYELPSVNTSTIDTDARDYIPMCYSSSLADGIADDPNGSTSQASDPADIGEFICRYIIEDNERNIELHELRKHAESQRARCATTTAEMSRLTKKHEKLQQELSRMKSQRLVWSQQLKTLQAVPLLFEKEDFL